MKNVCFNDQSLKFYAQVESHHGSPQENSESNYFDSNQKNYLNSVNMSQFEKIIMVQCGQRNDNYGLTGYISFSMAVCIGPAPTEPNNLQPVCIVLVLIVGITFFINAMSYLYVMGSVSIWLLLFRWICQKNALSAGKSTFCMDFCVPISFLFM